VIGCQSPKGLCFLRAGPVPRARARGYFQKNVTGWRQIDATDREIDRLVYELYGLTKEEIAIVEGAKA